MKRTILILLIAVMIGATCPVLSLAGSGQSESATAEEGYLIGPGDVLDISVWKDESLTRTCVVRPDGFISFPLIGDIKASGTTAAQLKAEMMSKLTRFVPGVVLSLDLREIRSLVVYVIGKVNNPGRFLLTSDINVLQALAGAGGLNAFAKRNDIKVFRQGVDTTTMFPFEYDQVVEGKRLEQNIYLNRGDVVVVP
jgi:polysaccharide biosynthesis/export protein